MTDRFARKEAFRLALRSGDPFQLANVLSLPRLLDSSSRNQTEQTPSNPPPETLLDSGVDWSGVLNAWLDASDAAQAGQAIKCFESQAALHAAFNHIFNSSPGNLFVPALHTVCKATHRAAIAADRESRSNDHSRLQRAVTLLQESFSRTFNDRKELKATALTTFDEQGSKKSGVLLIVNQLFSIYFRLNTLRLCKNLLRPVEQRKLHEQGTMGQMVTYRYYVGRINLFEDQYVEAEANLEFASKNCRATAIHNKKCILRYLIPVKIHRGRLPSAQLMSKYELHEFVPLVDGIRKGDLRKFNDALLEFQHAFIRQGTYLLLEKCKTVCYRNLFKRIHVILDKSQISLGHVANAFKWLGMPMDFDEIECILANLIYRGYIRGYLAHTKRILVLSKRDPFPVSSVIASK